MNIVQINETYTASSTGRIVNMLATEIRKTGNFCLVCAASGVHSDRDSVQIGSVMDHKLHALFSRITGKQGYFSQRATKKLIERLKQFHPDIVHLHNLHGNYINLELLFRYLAENDIATVITLHDCWLYTGKCTYYVPVRCEKWKKECGKCPLLRQDNVNPTFFFDRTRKCISDKRRLLGRIPRLAVVSVSRWICQEASQSLLQNAEQHMIYNGVDTEAFHPSVSNLRQQYHCENKFVILMVSSNISITKGYREMLGLAARCAPDAYQIFLIGKNRANLYIPPNVIWIGHVGDSSLLAQYYSMADVCVNTTQYETFGMVTAESICCGTPAIVYDNTASPEIVGPGCGYVVEEKDGITGLVDAVQKIREVGKQQYTSPCLTYAKEHLALRRSADQYFSLYVSLKNRQ